LSRNIHSIQDHFENQSEPELLLEFISNRIKLELSSKEENLLTTEEVMQMLCISTPLILRNLVGSGKLRRVNLGAKTKLYKRSEVSHSSIAFNHDRWL